MDTFVKLFKNWGKCFAAAWQLKSFYILILLIFLLLSMTLGSYVLPFAKIFNVSSRSIYLALLTTLFGYFPFVYLKACAKLLKIEATSNLVAHPIGTTLKMIYADFVFYFMLALLWCVLLTLFQAKPIIANTLFLLVFSTALPFDLIIAPLLLQSQPFWSTLKAHLRGFQQNHYRLVRHAFCITIFFGIFYFGFAKGSAYLIHHFYEKSLATVLANTIAYLAFLNQIFFKLSLGVTLHHELTSKMQEANS